MHGLMNVAEEMHHHLERKRAVGVSRGGIGEDLNLIAERHYYIAFIVDLSIFKSLVSVDIFVMPCFGICVFGRMRSIVEPV